MTQKPNPWVRGDDQLPSDPAKLVAEIRALAAQRRNDARTHEPECACDGCTVLERDAMLRRLRNVA